MFSGSLVIYNQMVVDSLERHDDETAADLQFGALADRTRRDILRRAQEGRLSVSALAREYPISLAAVQKHVAVLERAELVSKHRVGRESIVRAEPGALDRARAALDRLASEWRGRIERIDQHPRRRQRRQLMPVTDVKKDLDALTMTITAEFDAGAERVWELWSDPRQLERWWGPPSYPATFVEHDLSPGGRSAYFMTGPDGKKHHGWWRDRGGRAS